MRKILFRGQTRRYGEKVRMGDGFKLPSRWVYGGVLQGVSAHSIIYGGENADDPGEGLEKRVVHTDTLGQFTGKTDKNGKKVFEDDILQIFTVWADGTKEKAGIGIVQWCENDQCYVLTTKEGYHIDDFGNLGRPEYYEVIGNIYDNPELMEVHENGTV